MQFLFFYYTVNSMSRFPPAALSLTETDRQDGANRLCNPYYFLLCISGEVI